MAEEPIKLGDIVQVDFNNAQYALCSKAEILHIPQATGDSWRFRDCENGNIYYVSEGCTITKVVELGALPKADNCPKWQPTRPTWCWVWNDDTDNCNSLRIKRLVINSEDGLYYTINEDGPWDNAKPCEPPEWWFNEWK